MYNEAAKVSFEVSGRYLDFGLRYLEGVITVAAQIRRDGLLKMGKSSSDDLKILEVEAMIKAIAMVPRFDIVGEQCPKPFLYKVLYRQ